MFLSFLWTLYIERKNKYFVNYSTDDGEHCVLSGPIERSHITPVTARWWSTGWGCARGRTLPGPPAGSSGRRVRTPSSQVTLRMSETRSSFYFMSQSTVSSPSPCTASKCWQSMGSGRWAVLLTRCSPLARRVTRARPLTTWSPYGRRRVASPPSPRLTTAAARASAWPGPRPTPPPCMASSWATGSPTGQGTNIREKCNTIYFNLF